MSWLSEEEAAYPRDAFQSIISLNSPYAFYLFQWVPYQTEARRRRVKMMHDVKAFDGREEFGIWPNGSHCGTPSRMKTWSSSASVVHSMERRGRIRPTPRRLAKYTCGTLRSALLRTHSRPTSP